MQGKSGIFVGKTLDDAVKKGLEDLGLSRAAVMITVLEEGSAGFLGIGARPYRVRMAPRPRREMVEEGGRRGEGRGRDARPDSDRRPRQGGGRGEPRSGPRTRTAAARDSAPPSRRPGRSERAPGRRDEGPIRAGVGSDRGEVATPPRSDSARGPRDDDRGGRRRRGRGRPEGGGDGARPRENASPAHSGHRAEPAPSRREGAPATNAGSSEVPDLSPAQLQNVANEQTSGLLRAMGFEATVSARADGDSVEVKAEVPSDGELLVGPKGEVRQALQHLLNRMINRDRGSRYHLQLEVNDFWQQREEELQGLARRLADEATAEGREMVTEYLNAQERRIVHVTLKEDTRVTTQAIGEGLIKKISIAPAGSMQATAAPEALKHEE